MGPLTQATDGNFYGLADDGGSFTVCYNGCGTIFQLTSQGAETTLHAFDLVDGECPAGGLLQGTNGIFYGTTFAGGNSGDGDCSDGISAPGDGVVFSLDMGLGPFVNLVPTTQVIGKTVGILGQGFLGTTGVSFNGTPATFTVNSDTYIAAKVPAGVTDGLVTVVTPSGTRTSNLQFRLAP
jgi:hypothetical protein